MSKSRKNIFVEFRDFLNEYKVLGLAIAFVMGAAIVALVNSLVNDIVMPIITPFISGGAWKTATLKIGPVVLSWGSFVAALINFVIIALVVFMLAKIMLKEDKLGKK